RKQYLLPIHLIAFRQLINQHPAYIHFGKQENIQSPTNTHCRSLKTSRIVFNPIDRKLYRPILVFWIELINRLSVFIQKHQVFYMIKTLKHRQRSEEHTSELQSRENLVCRLLLEKKTTIT